MWRLKVAAVPRLAELHWGPYPDHEDVFFQPTIARFRPRILTAFRENFVSKDEEKIWLQFMEST